MAIAHVQNAYNDSNTNNFLGTLSKAFVSPNTAGNCLIVAVTLDDTLGSINTIGDTLGNTYGTPTHISGNSTQCWVYVIPNCLAGANTVNVTFSSPSTVNYPVLIIAEFSGLALSSPLDGTPPAATGNSTAPSSGNLTTSNANDLLFGVCSTDAGVTAGAGGSWTTIITSPDLTAYQYSIVSATGTYAATFTQNTGGWTVIMVAVKAAGGAPNPVHISTTLAPGIAIVAGAGRRMKASITI